HEVGPKPGTVLADAPAFFFVATFGGGLSYRESRQSLFPVLRNIELAEQFPDDLLLFPPSDSFSAAIPRRDPALRIHHKNGVVLQAIDHEAKPLFALPDRLLLELLVHAKQVNEDRDLGL